MVLGRVGEGKKGERKMEVRNGTGKGWGKGMGREGRVKERWKR